jgi:PAS domain S-box-containing protein
VALLTFALQFGQYNSLLTWRKLLLLLLTPAITVLLVFTNEQHGLIWLSSALDRSGPFVAVSVSYGQWFWVHFAYSYVLLLSGALLIIFVFRRQKLLYRRQAAVLIVAVVTPWLGNILYFSGLNPITQLDLTPFTLALTGVLFAWGIFGFRLLDLTPIARAAVLEGMRDGVVVLDARGRIADMNPVAATMIGRTLGQVLGKPASQVLDSKLDLALGRQSDLAADVQLAFGVGAERRNIEARLSLLRDHKGRSIGCLLVLRDVTEERKIERMRSDLIHTMVHDLRNPLTAIQASLDVLGLMQIDDVDGPDILAIAARSSRRLLSLVNAILDLSRLESGQMPLQRNALTLTSLIADISQLLAPLAAAKGQCIDLIVSSDLPEVLADADLMGRVLQNLIGNAIKFTPEGGRISVSAQPYADLPGYMQIAVSDTGPGIPEDIHDRLFEKFVTGANRENGSGLGLAFCRLVVEAHGGQIWLDSDSVPGTTFKLTIPAI